MSSWSWNRITNLGSDRNGFIMIYVSGFPSWLGRSQCISRWEQSVQNFWLWIGSWVEGRCLYKKNSGNCKNEIKAMVTYNLIIKKNEWTNEWWINQSINQSINWLSDHLITSFVIPFLFHSFPRFPLLVRTCILLIVGFQSLFIYFVCSLISWFEYIILSSYYYFKARLPVKWMPPESLFYGESTTMSDV